MRQSSLVMCVGLQSHSSVVLIGAPLRLPGRAGSLQATSMSKPAYERARTAVFVLITKSASVASRREQAHLVAAEQMRSREVLDADRRSFRRLRPSGLVRRFSRLKLERQPQGGQ